MIELNENDYIRIERSPYINGHFYLRIKNSKNDIKTLGFGYDEPYRDKNILFSNPIVISLRMFNAVLNPVKDKWVIYVNDYARNVKWTPNMYHIITEWIKMKKKTVNLLKDVINGINTHNEFNFPFSPITTNMANNCRSILLFFIKDSLSKKGYSILEEYFNGNPFLKDSLYGCMFFRVDDDGNIFYNRSHPCGLCFGQSCCKDVEKPKDLCVRIPVKCVSIK